MSGAFHRWVDDRAHQDAITLPDDGFDRALCQLGCEGPGDGFDGIHQSFDLPMADIVQFLAGYIRVIGSMDLSEIHPQDVFFSGGRTSAFHEVVVARFVPM
jgi:hypothetical protein